jgi:hypothetical protein
MGGCGGLDLLRESVQHLSDPPQDTGDRPSLGALEGESQWDVADQNPGSLGQNRLAHALAIDKGPVGRTQISDLVLVSCSPDAGMATRHAGMVQENVEIRGTTDGRGALVDEVLLVLASIRSKDERGQSSLVSRLEFEF